MRSHPNKADGVAGENCQTSDPKRLTPILYMLTFLTPATGYPLARLLLAWLSYAASCSGAGGGA